MTEHSSILNIPQLFTQYRTRILEDTGRSWFHADYDTNPAVTDAVESLVSSVIPESVTSQEIEEQPEKMAALELEAIADPPHYHHPDPWDTPPLPVEPILIPWKDFIPEKAVPDSSPESSVSPVSLATESEIRIASPSEPPLSSGHPVSNVNLFPFGQAAQSEDLDWVEFPEEPGYDLTQYDNGEIEVPPEAIRDSQTASFERVTSGEDSSEADRLEAEKARRKKPKPQPSSAEIAKFRLRNCL